MRMESARHAFARKGWFLYCLLLGLLVAEARPAATAAPQSAPVLIPDAVKRAEDAPAGVIAPQTRYATPYYVVDSGVAGPCLVITGGVHGDETAGAAAAEEIRHWRVQRGRMIVIPRANVPGLDARKRNMPGVKAELANLNRNFPRAGREEEPRGILARAIWAQLKGWKPDWVIDLHEGGGFRAQTTQSVGSSLIPVPESETRRLATRMHAAVNATISIPGRQFTLLRLPVDGSLARAAGEHLAAHAMILETTTKGQTLALRVKQHEVMVRTLLEGLGMVAAEPAAAVAVSARN